MKVFDFKYKRPDAEKLQLFFTDATSAFDSADAAEQKKLFLKVQKKNGTVRSLQVFAELNFLLNTNDSFWTAEREFWDGFLPVLAEADAAFKSKILTDSKPEFRSSLPEILLKLYEAQSKTVSPDIIEDMREENALITEYSKTINGNTAVFNGEKLPFATLRKFMQDGDRKIRAKAFAAAGNFLREHGAAFDEIYDKLVKVRNRMARKLGYGNFVELGYYRMARIAFDKDDVAAFRQNIVSDIVPIVSKLKKIQAKDLKIRSMMLYDNDNYFLGGEPAPTGSVDEIFKAGKAMYEDMSPLTAEFINYMLDNDAFDVLSREGKWGGGMCTYIPDIKQPFILANFNGSAADVDVLTHEAGHALAAYCARNLRYLDLQQPGYESCEIHSMSMEFFAWKYMQDFFGGRADDYKYKHLSDALTFLPYGTMVDHFQHTMYENENLTPRERKDEWLRLEKIYRPDLDLKGIPYFEEGGRWQYQMHIFEMPFYYIDYCLAQSVALQFLLASLKDYDKAFKRYFSLLKCAGTKDYLGLVRQARLKSPLTAGNLKKVGRDILKLIKEIKK